MVGFPSESPGFKPRSAASVGKMETHMETIVKYEGNGLTQVSNSQVIGICDRLCVLLGCDFE